MRNVEFGSGKSPVEPLMVSTGHPHAKSVTLQAQADRGANNTNTLSLPLGEAISATRGSAMGFRSSDELEIFRLKSKRLNKQKNAKL